MGRVALILSNDETKRRAAGWVMKAPPGCRFELKEPKRTVPQSDKMWAMLTDLARQHLWHGQRLSANDYKILFMSALNTELRIVPNLEGTGFVPLGRSSSDLDRDEMSQLLELIAAFAAQHGIALGGS